MRLGPYEVLSAIGAGGMGEVYRARDTRLDRTVAIKTLTPRLAEDPLFRERFEREARSVSRLSHPHICTLHDVGTESRQTRQPIYFRALEYLEGETLAARLRRGSLAVDDVLRIRLRYRQRARGRASAGRRASGPQAGQRHVDQRRREATRLRVGEAGCTCRRRPVGRRGASNRVGIHHERGRDSGDASIHGARATGKRRSRRAKRSVRVRRGHVHRDAHRPGRIPRGEPCEPRRRNPEG